MGSPELQLLLATLGGLRFDNAAEDGNKTRGTATMLTQEFARQIIARTDDASAAASAHLLHRCRRPAISYALVCAAI
jgi:hypothetical protein